MPNTRRTRSKQWRQIARAADGSPRSAYAIAKALGTDAGAIHSAIESMCADGILRAKETARGKAYALTASGRRALAEGDPAIDARKAFDDASRVLLVVDEGRSIAPALLAEIAADPSFAWSVRLDGLVRWIAVFAGDDPEAVDRAATRVEAAGARPIVGRADAIYNAVELTDYATRLARSPRALSP